MGQIQQIIWEPQQGPQTSLLTCPVQDIFFGGSRGGGKTDGFLGHWLEHADRYKTKAKGILFRPSYPELDEIVRRSHELFLPLGARWQDGKHRWRMPGGAELNLRHLDNSNDADKYIGHQYTWMAVEELTRWAMPESIDKVRGSLRSPHGVPCWFLANANPGGRGHQWVKDRYISTAPPMEPFWAELPGGARIRRVYIPSRLTDNKYLRNDMQYLSNLHASGPEWLVRAWVDGDWDVAPGSFLEHEWDPKLHVVDPFDIPIGWKRWRAMDWGYARPYSVGWYAIDFDGKVYRYRELYGYGGAPNKGTRESAEEVALIIKKTEGPEIKAGITFRNNPADAAMWSKTGTEHSIAEHFTIHNIRWTPMIQRPGSRVLGAQEIIHRLKTNSFAVFSTCKHFLRTIPTITPDSRNMEDVDTAAEDHVWDEVKGSLLSRRTKTAQPPDKDTSDDPDTMTFKNLYLLNEKPKKSRYRR